MSILINIDEGKYEYPDRPSKPSKVCPSCGKSFAFIDSMMEVKFCPSCGGSINYGALLEGWKEQCREWKNQCAEIEERFKKDLFKYLDIENHPKRERLFEIAWGLGHSEGLRSVVEYAEELVDLLS